MVETLKDSDRLAGIDRGSFANRFRDGGAAGSGSSAPSAATVDPDAFLLVNSDHQGASSSPLRGYVYWRTTDTRRQITDYTDAEIQRRLDFLYNHFGVCRRLVDGMASLCGVLTPQPNTADDPWNEESFDAFQFGACSPEVYDAGGRFDFYSGQIVTNQNRFRAGRSLGVLTETVSKRAQMAFYDPWQIDHNRRGVSGRPIGGAAMQDRRRFVRGVELNRHSKHLAYFLRNAEKPEEAPFRIPARDAIYFGKFDNHNQVHPLSVLAGAIVNMIDVAETRSSWKAQIKSSGRRGEVIERKAGSNVIHTGGGIHSQPVEVKVTQPDGSGRTVELEQVYGTGPEIQKLAEGEELKLITDDRPSVQNLEFDKTIVSDCANFANLPPEALFEIAGITGPGIRYHMDQIERWILLQHLWQARWCQRFYTYAIAKEIKAGRLRKPVDEDGNAIEWWRPSQVVWIGLPSLTIDKGKEGKLSIVQLDAGLTTWADEWGSGGAFWKKKITQRVIEVGFAKLRVWEESKRLEEKTEGEVTLDIKEVFKFAGINASGSSGGTPPPAPDPELAERVEDVESNQEEQEEERELDQAA